jgi:predicted component of type VI protein secretion system
MAISSPSRKYHLMPSESTASVENRINIKVIYLFATTRLAEYTKAIKD